MVDRYMNEKEISEYTGFATQTLRNYRATGRGPAYCKVGKAVRYAKSDVIKWMEAHKVLPTVDDDGQTA